MPNVTGDLVWKGKRPSSYTPAVSTCSFLEEICLTIATSIAVLVWVFTTSATNFSVRRQCNFRSRQSPSSDQYPQRATRSIVLVLSRLSFFQRKTHRVLKMMMAICNVRLKKLKRPTCCVSPWCKRKTACTRWSRLMPRINNSEAWALQGFRF